MNYEYFKKRVCGPEELYSGGILDWNMAGPCANHDDCYSDCNMPKGICDTKLKIEMLQVCDAKYPNNPFMRNICRAQAKFYHMVMSSKIALDAFKLSKKNCPDKID